MPRRYETNRGTVTLRRETPMDAAFLLTLFSGHARRPLEYSALPSDAIAKMVDMQFRSSNATHHTLFPDAVYSIIECDGEPIGRIIEADEGDTVYYVDFALLPGRQAKGLGTAFIDKLCDEWAARGKSARVEVMMTNSASLKLCGYCGFVETGRTPNGYVHLKRIVGATQSEVV